MVYSIILNLLTFFACFTGDQLHEFYVSVNHLTYSQAAQRFEWSCRMFKDDYEGVLREDNSKAGLTFDQSDSSHIVDLVEYFNQHVTIEGVSTFASWRLYSIRVEGSGPTTTLSCDFHLAADLQDRTSTIIRCSLLTDILEDQINMIHVEISDVRKSKNLDIHRQIMEVAL